MSAYLDAFYAPMFLIMGLSHAAHPRLWADFFVAMKHTGFAPLIIGMYTLPTGLVLVVGHNRWAWGWPLFFTIAGWGMTVKATIYLLFPGLPNRMIGNADRWENTFGGFRVAGAVMAVYGAILTWLAFKNLPV